MAAKWGKLPDAAVCCILNHLSAVERYRNAVLVCKAWRRAVDSPELLRDLDISLDSETQAGCVRQLRALPLWLERRAQHMHSLRLDLEGTWLSIDEAHAAEAALLVSRAMAVAAAGGGLRKLHVFLGIVAQLQAQPPVLSTWLSSSTLHSLDFGAVEEPVIKVASLGGLPALRELSLIYSGGELQLGDEEDAGGARPYLHPTLTLLHLYGYREELPPQVGALPSLAKLTLECCNHTAEGYAPLQQLNGSLRQLELLELGRGLPRSCQSWPCSSRCALKRCQTTMMLPARTVSCCVLRSLKTAVNHSPHNKQASLHQAMQQVGRFRHGAGSSCAGD
ncbi:hypothetical protein ABPG75_003604 [Micractinium tetrahymenae]